MFLFASSQTSLIYIWNICWKSRFSIYEIISYITNYGNFKIFVLPAQWDCGIKHIPLKLVGSIWILVRSCKRLEKWYLQAVQPCTCHWWMGWFILFHTCFWRESKIQYSSPRTWNTSRFSAISDTVAPLTLQQDRTKQGQSVIMPPGSWVTSDHWAVFPCV